MKVISKLNESFELIDGFHDKYIHKSVYDDMKESNKNLIDNLKGKIVELTTELTYRDGLLNCRGIIEKTERKFCYSFATHQSSNRKVKWKLILNEDRSLLNSLQLLLEHL